MKKYRILGFIFSKDKINYQPKYLSHIVSNEIYYAIVSIQSSSTCSKVDKPSSMCDID